MGEVNINYHKMESSVHKADICVMLCSAPRQVDPKRVLTDMEGEKWLRIEDAGYMDGEGRLWLVGRVKWRVERDGKTHWSTVVEQKVKLYNNYYCYTNHSCQYLKTLSHDIRDIFRTLRVGRSYHAPLIEKS